MSSAGKNAVGGGSPPSRGPACLLLPATLIPPCSGLQAEGLQLTWGCSGPARLNEARLSTGRQQPGAGHKRGAQEISHHDRLSPMSHQQGDLVCESLTLCPHVSGADWRGPVLTPQGCGELETFCRGRSTCQLQTQRVRSNTLGFLHLCKCLSFHYSKKKSVLKKGDHFSSFPALSVAGAGDILFRVADSVSVWGRQASGEWAPFRNFYWLRNIIQCFPAII